VVDDNLKGLVPFLPLNPPDRATPAPTLAPPPASSQPKGASR